MSSPLIVLRLSACTLSAASELCTRQVRHDVGFDAFQKQQQRDERTRKLMNSETHSWTHSLASFAIFAESGREFFMILPTFAI
jgi:hypothetical protein